MTTVIQINGKKMSTQKIREKRKQNWDTPDFAKFFKVTEASFLKTMRKKAGDQFESFNFTEPGKEAQNVGMGVVIARISYDSVEKAEVLVADMKNDTVDNVEVMNDNDREAVLEARLASLRQESEKLSEEFTNNEKAISEKSEEFEATQRRLQEIFNEVIKLREELFEIEGDISNLKQHSEEILDRFSQNENEIVIAEAELSEYRTAEVYYDEDGLHISKSVEVSKEAVMDKCLEFLEADAYPTCPSKDLKGIASIHVAISTLKDAGTKYAVVLEKCTENIRSLIVLPE